MIPVREYEGLARETTILYGDLQPDETIHLQNIVFAIDLHSQNRALPDQKEQYARVAAL